MSDMSHPQFLPVIACPTSHDTIKSLRGQLEIIQVYIDHFFATVKDSSLRDLFPKTISFSPFPGSIIPENMDIIDCQTDHLPQLTLSAIRIALSHLMIERLKSVFKLILLASQTGKWRPHGIGQLFSHRGCRRPHLHRLDSYPQVPTF